ncbi:non-specific serine/threonine protein kinase [Anaeramoeba flamelloides]|uniref:non-specific serine/threonine protein kinase n=1 Tax=Anaeramoeba flamelloides TaxID=1746091 RepID=A0AAV7YG14_9EUKA|nr:non-specific serine/threonine protein kinase [Anaeramoeba flamelloides]
MSLRLPKFSNYVIKSPIKNSHQGKTVIAEHKLTKENTEIRIFHKLKSYLTNDLGSLLNQLRIAQSFRHPQIIRLLEIVEDNKRYCVVSEQFPDSTSLWKYQANKGPISSLIEIQKIFQQLLSVFTYFHSKKFYFGNFTSKMVKINSNSKLKIHWKNFKKISPNENTAFSFFRAPELSKKDPNLSAKCDVWTLGILLHQLIMGTNTFSKLNYKKKNYYKNIRKKVLKLNSSVPKTIVKLLSKMLKLDELDRISLSEIEDYLWFERDDLEKNENNKTNENKKKTKQEQEEEQEQEQEFEEKKEHEEFDYTILKEMKSHNFDLNELIFNLIQGNRNQMTTTYYLFQLQKKRQNLQNEEVDKSFKLEVSQILNDLRTKKKNNCIEKDQNKISKLLRVSAFDDSAIQTRQNGFENRNSGEIGYDKVVKGGSFLIGSSIASLPDFEKDDLELPFSLVDIDNQIFQNDLNSPKQKKNKAFKSNPLKNEKTIKSKNLMRSNSTQDDYTNPEVDFMKNELRNMLLQINSQNKNPSQTNHTHKANLKPRQQKKEIQKNTKKRMQARIHKPKSKSIQIINKKEKKNVPKQTKSKVINPREAKKIQLVKKTYGKYINNVLKNDPNYLKKKYSPRQLNRIRKKTKNTQKSKPIFLSKNLSIQRSSTNFSILESQPENDFKHNQLSRKLSNNKNNHLLDSFSKSMDYRFYMDDKLSKQGQKKPIEQYNSQMDEILEILNSSISSMPEKKLLNEYIKVLDEMGVSYTRMGNNKLNCLANFRGEKLKFEIGAYPLPNHRGVRRVHFKRIDCNIWNFYAFWKIINQQVTFL